jgi:hypothetical protein
MKDQGLPQTIAVSKQHEKIHERMRSMLKRTEDKSYPSSLTFWPSGLPYAFVPHPQQADILWLLRVWPLGGRSDVLVPGLGDGEKPRSCCRKKMKKASAVSAYLGKFKLPLTVGNQ